MKNLYRISIFVIMTFTFLLIITSCKKEKTNDINSITKVALREAGHQLLPRNLDSTSLILPIKELQPYAYSISFEKPLGLEPSNIVKIIDSSLNWVNISKYYRVEVLQCADGELAYSYEVNVEDERTVIPCAGRFLPVSCYTINVAYLDILPQSVYGSK